MKAVKLTFRLLSRAECGARLIFFLFPSFLFFDTSNPI